MFCSPLTFQFNDGTPVQCMKSLISYQTSLYSISVGFFLLYGSFCVCFSNNCLKGWCLFLWGICFFLCGVRRGGIKEMRVVLKPAELKRERVPHLPQGRERGDTLVFFVFFGREKIKPHKTKREREREIKGGRSPASALFLALSRWLFHTLLVRPPKSELASIHTQLFSSPNLRKKDERECCCV